MNISTDIYVDKYMVISIFLRMPRYTMRENMILFGFSGIVINFFFNLDLVKSCCGPIVFFPVPDIIICKQELLSVYFGHALDRLLMLLDW